VFPAVERPWKRPGGNWRTRPLPDLRERGADVVTANARKGSETERMVAKYLQGQGFPLADRRLREGRADDQGDIDGVPYTTIQVKYVAQPRLQSWVGDTLKQRAIAGNPLCLLVVRRKQKPPAHWDAYMPSSYFMAGFEYAGGGLVDGQLDEREAWTWMRMDLALAVIALKRMSRALSGLSARSSRTTSTGSMRDRHELRALRSAPSTGSESPPSATT
jgi:hypothetical protein